MTLKYYFATGNDNKFEEVSRILKKMGPIELVRVDIDIDEIQGTQEEITFAKLETIFNLDEQKRLLDYFEFDGLFVEDVGLYCDGLYGMPGPYIKSAQKGLGLENLSTLVHKTGNTKAQAVCCYSVCLFNENKVVTVTGSVPGNIVNPKGVSNFGFDRIFHIEPVDKTFAQMDQSTKDFYSHRMVALRELYAIL